MRQSKHQWYADGNTDKKISDVTFDMKYKFNNLNSLSIEQKILLRAYIERTKRMTELFFKELEAFTK